MSKSKKIFFASDIHLGTPNKIESRKRETIFINWLDSIIEECESLFLVGDIFDFWFDYKHVVPKGYVRLFSKLTEFTAKNIPVHFFKGNHDMWLDGYFEDELGLIIHNDNYSFETNGVQFYVGHGDGKGPKDYKYKFLKKIFRNPISQWLFRWVHPDVGMSLAHFWSRKSRYGTDKKEPGFLGEEGEWLIQYIQRKHQLIKADYYVFGHRHLPIQHKIDEKSTYFNLGDWINYQSYGVFDGQKMELRYYTD